MGLSLDAFLQEEGILEEVRAVVLKETLDWQVQQARERDEINKEELAGIGALD
ncbi:MAG: hypothetical protein NTV70_01575 [Acidobacteria bacterium]|nr:hypothetical protein [Acidobacteriota bacterium]